MKRYLLFVGLACVFTAGAAGARVLTHPSAEGLSGSQVATLLGPKFDGTTRGAIALVRERSADASWYPPGPVKAGDTLYSEAVVAPGSYNVAVACIAARWSRVFTVDLDAAAGRVYRFTCEVIPIDENRVAAKVVVSEEGALDEFALLKGRAEKGDAVAQNDLGAMYSLGQSVERDDVEAVRWLRKSAEQGFASAQSNLGAMYAEGRGVAQDGAEAVRWYAKAAEQGLAAAQYNLGELYELGRAVPRDVAEAYYWFALAAAVEPSGPVHDEAVNYRDRIAAQLTPAQIAEAQKRVQAWLKAHPLRKPIAAGWAKEVPSSPPSAQPPPSPPPSPPDTGEAEDVVALRKRAEQGVAQAQNDLGARYAEGRGLPQDYVEAVKWYRRAAEQGYAGAHYNLGNMYLLGNGVPQDDAEAMKWYRGAADQGLAIAQYNLGLAYLKGQGVPRDQPEAAKWFRRAAEQGHADAQHSLGVMFINALGVPKDDAEAAQWFSRAAVQGHPHAQTQLGLMYAGGRAMPQDNVEAMKWLGRAAEQGDAQAQFNLGVGHFRGQGVSQDYVEAYKWVNLAVSGAAKADHERYVKARETIAAAMSAAQLAEAQRRASEWMPKPEKP